jgi:hypothetical protein
VNLPPQTHDPLGDFPCFFEGVHRVLIQKTDIERVENLWLNRGRELCA